HSLARRFCLGHVSGHARRRRWPPAALAAGPRAEVVVSRHEPPTGDRGLAVRQRFIAGRLPGTALALALRAFPWPGWGFLRLERSAGLFALAAGGADWLDQPGDTDGGHFTVRLADRGRHEPGVRYIARHALRHSRPTRLRASGQGIVAHVGAH